eukprot:scaffold243092_cov18-Tisochrysis_lutea.AAC.1
MVAAVVPPCLLVLSIRLHAPCDQFAIVPSAIQMVTTADTGIANTHIPQPMCQRAYVPMCIAANVGDARVLLVKSTGETVQLTVDHVPDDENERRRIQSFNPNPKLPLVQLPGLIAVTTPLHAGVCLDSGGALCEVGLGDYTKPASSSLKQNAM